MKHKKILACFLTFSFLLTGCSTKDQSQSLSMTGTYFDTVVKIEVWGADSKIMDGCKDICEKYEQLLSPTIDSSEISQINQAQGASVSVSKETADLIELGKYYGDLSWRRTARFLQNLGHGISIKALCQSTGFLERSQTPDRFLLCGL